MNLVGPSSRASVNLARFVALVIAGTSAIGLGACVSEGDHYADSAEVVEGWDAIAESPEGVVVRLPDGAASGGELSVVGSDDVAGVDAESGSGESHPDSIRSREVGPAAEVRLEGGELTGEITVELPLSDGSDALLVGVEQWDPVARSWVPVPDDGVEVADAMVILDSDELGTFRPSWISLDALVDQLGSNWESFGSSESVGADPPVCPGDQAGDLRAAAQDGQGLLSCSAITGDGELVVEVVNDRPFPVEIHVPDGLEPTRRNGHDRPLMTALSVVGSIEGPIIGPAEGIGFKAPEAATGKLTIGAYVTPRSWTVAMLDMALSTYGDLWAYLVRTTGVPDMRTTTELLAAAVPGTPCVQDAVAEAESVVPVDTDPADLFRDAARCGAEVFARAVEDEPDAKAAESSTGGTRAESPPTAESGYLDPEIVAAVKGIVTDRAADGFAALEVAAEFPDPSSPG